MMVSGPGLKESFGYTHLSAGDLLREADVKIVQGEMLIG